MTVAWDQARPRCTLHFRMDKPHVFSLYFG